jgi:hypothetical protein
MKTKNVLLCINNVPDSLDFFYLPNITLDDLKVLRKAHGHYLNSDAEGDVATAICSIMAAVERPEYKDSWRSDAPKDWCAKNWLQYKVDLEKSVPIEACRLVITGQMM